MNGFTPAELLRFTVSAEKFSTHPAARALQQLAEEAGVSVPDPVDFRETAGRGVTACVQGRTLLVGRAAWLNEHGIEGFEPSVDVVETAGYSLVFVAVDAQCAGWIAFQDRVRAESAAPPWCPATASPWPNASPPW